LTSGRRKLLTGSGAGRVDAIRDPVGSNVSVLARDVKKERKDRTHLMVK
jgi:hypothetical protein